MHRTEVFLSTKKVIPSIITLIVVAILLAWFGILLRRYPFPAGVYVLGGLLLVLICFGIVQFIRLLWQTKDKASFVVDETGFLDNRCTSPCQLTWAEIRDISTIYINRSQTKVIIIKLNDPERFINEQQTPRKRKRMTTNYKKYGSPLLISTGFLDITADKLYSLMQAHVG